MPELKLENFKGSVPRVAPHLLSKERAAVALDCKLHKGLVQSWNETDHVERRDVAEGMALHLIDCCWIELPLCADVAFGSIDCRQIYVTGRSSYPEVGKLDRETCTISWQRLGLPCPYKRPEIVFTSRPLDKSSEVRMYAYQYVNNLGERSALSPPSEPGVMNDGTKVIVSGWEIPDPSWNVTKVRIYRSTEGPIADNDVAATFNSEYMYVGEVDIDKTSFVDTVITMYLMEAVEEDIVLPPPETLKGITQIDGANFLAGFTGNRVYFSKNNSYNNWPHNMSLDDNVKAIVSNSGTMYVMTDGAPYVMSLDSNCETAGCLKVMRHGTPYPMAGFGNRHVSAVPGGAVYPTAQGLVYLSGNNVPTYLTSALYSPEDWQALMPETMLVVLWQQYIFVFARNGAFVVKALGVRDEWEHDSHSSLSDRDVINVFTARNGDLYLIKKDGAHRWNASADKRPHFWVSPEVLSGVPINFASFKIISFDGNENVKVFSDEREILNRDVYKIVNVFTLPLWGAGQSFRVELKGVANVKAVALATSNKEFT